MQMETLLAQTIQIMQEYELFSAQELLKQRTFEGK
jgi:hypothetical protein